MVKKVISCICLVILILYNVNATIFAGPIEDAQSKLDAAKRELLEHQKTSITTGEIISGEIKSTSPDFIIYGYAFGRGESYMIIEEPNYDFVMFNQYMFAVHEYKGTIIKDSISYFVYGQAKEDPPEYIKKSEELNIKIENLEKELQKARTGFHYEGERNASGLATGKGALIYNDGSKIEGFFNNNIVVLIDSIVGNPPSNSITYISSREINTLGYPTFFIDNGYIFNRYGKLVKTDMPPTIVEGRTLIPLRALSDEIGIKPIWNGIERKIDFLYEEKSITLWVDKTVALVNGKEVILDIAPKILNGRTMIPLRFIVENLSMETIWHEKCKAVQIYKVSHTIIPFEDAKNYLLNSGYARDNLNFTILESSIIPESINDILCYTFIVSITYTDGSVKQRAFAVDAYSRETYEIDENGELGVG